MMIEDEKEHVDRALRQRVPDAREDTDTFKYDDHAGAR